MFKPFERVNREELMDTLKLPADVMKKVLGFLRVTNIYFGGIKVVLNHLDAWSPAWRPEETIRILDVGTGGGEIPLAISAWAKTRGLNVQVTGVDAVPEIAAIARAQTRHDDRVEIRRDDLFEMSQRNEKFDYVIASLFLHHIPPSQNGDALRVFDRMAARGVIVSDLLRTRAGYCAVAALSRLIGNSIVRHDGPLSVRRAFLPEELRRLAMDAGCPYLKSRREPWFRVSLAGEKIHAV